MIKERVIKAYNFAKQKHEGQKRAFVGLPYFTHPKYVARIVERLTGNEYLVAASLLHDVIEDCNITFDELEKEFGKEVANIVNELTTDENEKSKVGKSEYLANKMCLMSDNALTVKLADRYHNVLFLKGDKVPATFVHKYVAETVRILNVVTASRKLNEVQTMLVKKIGSLVEILKHEKP